MTISPRCFVCDARAFQPTERTLVDPAGCEHRFGYACGSCGVLVRDPDDAAACRDSLDRRLATGRFASSDLAAYGFDPFTLRIAASARVLGVRPLGAAQQEALRQPHSRLAAEADLFALVEAPATPISLGLCCRAGELPAVLAGLRPHAAWTEDVVVLVDDAPCDAAPVDVEGFAGGGVRVAARPLGGDFAAQRNALSALAKTGWMLQLDADETLEPSTGPLLGALAADAEANGVVSIGLRRRNLVDGVLSDLFPDTQYRLNRAGFAYAGVVHERPATDWRQTTIALHGAIVHHLAHRHVMTRSARYEGLSPGHGRLQEQDRLLTAYTA